MDLWRGEGTLSLFNSVAGEKEKEKRVREKRFRLLCHQHMALNGGRTARRPVPLRWCSVVEIEAADFFLAISDVYALSSLLFHSAPLSLN